MAEMADINNKPSRKGELRDFYKKYIPDYNMEDDEAAAGQAMDWLNGKEAESQKRKEDNEKLAASLRKDPRMAQLFSDFVSGKRGAAEGIARYYGRDIINAEEGTPEYEAIAKAEEERRQELEDAIARDKEYADNIEKSKAVWDEWSGKNGVDIEDLLDESFSKIIKPIMKGEYTAEVLDALYKAVNYDKDVKDSMEAGVVRGKNENINKMREVKGDGMPAVTSANPGQERPKPKKPNDILSLAGQA